MKDKGQQQAASCIVVKAGVRNRPGDGDNNHMPERCRYNTVSLPEFVGWRHPLYHEQWYMPQAPYDSDDDARGEGAVAVRITPDRLALKVGRRKTMESLGTRPTITG